MELREYLDIIRRRWWIPAGLTLAALLASLLVALNGAAAYQTDMRLSISTLPTVDRADMLYYDPVYYANLSSEYLADDLSELIRSEAFAVDVSRELGFPLSPTTIASITRARKTHRLLDVTISTPTQEQGEAVGRAMATILNDAGRMGGYLRALDAYKAQVSIVNRPVTHRGSGTLSLVSEVGLRTLLGLVLGIGLAFLAHYLDTTVRSRAEAEDVLGLPILAEIPRAGRGARA